MIDIYSYRTMMAALMQMLPARTFLRDMFFRNTVNHTTLAVDIDIMRGKRRMAAFVNPIAEGQVVGTLGYRTDTYEPPSVKPKTAIKPRDLLQREAGTTIYAPGDSPAVRSQRALGRILGDHDEMITRREEWMCASALDSGTITVVGEGVNAVIDFNMPAAHKVTLTGTDLWTDAAGTPLDDLVDWASMVSQASGLVVNTAIVGLDVWKALRANAQFSKALDTRLITLGKIDPKLLPDGVTYLGTITEAGVGLDLYSYHEWYVDPVDDLEKPMVPADKIWLGSTRALATRHYGAVQDIDAGGLVAVSRFPKSWVEKDPSVRWVMTQSSPLMALHQSDAFFSAKVV